MSEPAADKKRTPSGRVRHDPGGRAVWEWAIDSGRYAIDSTSLLLKKLDLTSLRLVGDGEKEGRAVAQPQGGFDPYDSRAPLARGGAKPSASATAARPPLPRMPERRQGLFARLFGR